MIEMNGSYRNYIRSVVSGLENPMEVILKEIETYETEGTFLVSSEAGNVGSYVSSINAAIKSISKTIR